MDFTRYLDIRRPGESFEQYEHRLKEFGRVQEEGQLRKMNRGLGRPPSMSGINGISGRDESYTEFCVRMHRERVEAELQRTKQNTKKLILLL